MVRRLRLLALPLLPLLALPPLLPACAPASEGSSSSADSELGTVGSNDLNVAAGMTCGALHDLEKIKLGTLDDLLEDTADYRKGITS